MITWRQSHPVSRGGVVIPGSGRGITVVPNPAGGFTVLEPTPARFIDFYRPPIVQKMGGAIVVIPQTPPDRITEDEVIYDGHELVFA